MGDKPNGEISINSDQATVMDVIADLEKYPEWSDGVKKVEVLDKTPEGRPITARFTFASGPIKDVFVLKYAWNGNDSVSWELTEGNVLTQQEGTYALSENSDGSIQVTYDLEVGINMPLPGLLKRKFAKQIVNMALGGLKKRVESL